MKFDYDTKDWKPGNTYNITVSYLGATTQVPVTVIDNSSIVTVLGDVDGDEEVGVIDATYIQRYEAGFSIPISEEDILLRGDVDGDGEVTVIDATYIQRYDAGFNTPYHIGELL